MNHFLLYFTMKENGKQNSKTYLLIHLFIYLQNVRLVMHRAEKKNAGRLPTAYSTEPSSGQRKLSIKSNEWEEDVPGRPAL